MKLICKLFLMTYFSLFSGNTSEDLAMAPSFGRGILSFYSACLHLMENKIDQKKFPPLSIHLDPKKRTQQKIFLRKKKIDWKSNGAQPLCAKMRHGGMMRNATIYDLVTMLLYSSFLFNNQELQQGLWAYLYLPNPPCFDGNTGFHV